MNLDSIELFNTLNFHSEDIRKIKSLLNSNNINLQDKFGKTPLHKLIGKNCELVTYILNRDIDINLQDNNGHTALHLAIIKKDTKTALAILENVKININIEDNSGNDFMHYAIKKQNIDIIDKLLKSKYKIDKKDRRGDYPIHKAIKEQNIEVIKKLIDSKANLNKIDFNKNTPLHLAILLNNIEIVKYIIKYKIDRTIRNNLGLSPIYYAIRIQNREALQILLENNFDSDKNKFSTSPLHLSSELNDIESSKIIIKHNRKYLMEEDIKGNIPLHKAAFKNRVKMVEFILSEGVDVNYQNSLGFTSLHTVASLNFGEVIKVLLSHKDIDVNLRDIDGNIAIHKAVFNNKVGSITLLLDKSDLTIVNNNGFTPLELAKALNKNRAIEIIEAYLEENK